MVRRMRAADLDAVADIWLSANLEAHSFISPQYWQDRFEAVKGMLREAELYVCEDGGGLQGFVGLDGDYIAGIFVRSGARSRGTGRQLLDMVKGTRAQLSLSVYRKNSRAVKFYLREGFQIQEERRDGDTNEMEYQMVWKGQSRRT